MDGVPDIQQDEIAIDENDPNVVLGEGAFGIVYRGKCRGLNVAIKMPKSFDLTDEQLQEFKDEVRMMAKLYHPRIALFMGACIAGSEVSVVSELLDGDIEHVLARDKSLSLYQKMLYARQAAQGMAWVHGAGVIHRDLKPSNLLYSKAENAVKVCDFGFTILVKDKAKAQQTKGSPYYMAPELLMGEGATPKSDVYAYGIILHFLITGNRVPFEGAEDMEVSEVFGLVINGGRPVLPDKKMACPSSLRALCEQCWDQDPQKRPTFEGIIGELNTKVLVDCAVFSGKGRKLWKTCFVAGEELRESAPFHEFLDCLCKYFTEDGVVPRPTDAAYKCLREIFCLHDGQEEVRLATFGRMLGFFGPLEKGVWLSNVLEVFREPWFWGDTSREIACQKLASEPRGTFLVRYASEDSYFTISYVALNQQGKKEIFHTRVVHNYGSTHFVIPTTRAGSRTCASLSEVVRSLREGAAQLMNKACGGGPYSSFFAESSVDSGYGVTAGGYAASIESEFPEDDLGPAAISGSLKESAVAFPRHLVMMPNDSDSPMVGKKLPSTSALGSPNSPAPKKGK